MPRNDFVSKVNETLVSFFRLQRPANKESELSIGGAWHFRNREVH